MTDWLAPLPLGVLACGYRKGQIVTMPKPTIPPALETRLREQAARLRRLRIALNTSQAEAARLSGVSTYKWHRMERGDHPIDPLALQIFCEHHGTGADYVITARKATLRDDLLGSIALAEKEDREDQSPGYGRQEPSMPQATDRGSPPPDPNAPNKTKRKQREGISEVAA